MKQLITILALLATLPALGQKKALSQYIEKSGGQVFRVVVFIYPDATLDTVSTPVDSLDLLRELVQDIDGRANAYRDAVNDFWAADELPAQIARTSSYIETITGFSAFEYSARQYGQQAAGSWQVSTNGGDTFNAATITRPTNETLEITVGQQKYPVYVFRDQLIRIAQFQGGVNLVRVGNDAVFQDITQNIILKK